MAARDLSYPLLLICFFLSGLAALVYETAWTREFAFVFGTSELAVATVLAAYMGGLALGAAIAGRLVARITRPVLAYGLLELGIALAALAVPLGIAASRWLYVSLFAGLDLPESGGLATALFYLLCSFAILLVPTAMMGATLPLLTRHAVRSEAQIGARVGVLYAVNTAGAVVGVLLAAFVLLPALGLRTTILCAAAVNALVFVAAWALARSASPATAEADATARDPGSGRARWILPLILVSGFVSFSYEVLWVRLLGHLLGSGVHAFATMLASFLAGIALGSAAAARFARSPRGAALGFGLAQLGIAALSLLAFAGLHGVLELRIALAGRGLPEVWIDTLAAMSTLFPAALCIGATFPFAVRVLARHGEDASPASARVYATNTVGSIAGSIAAGFLLVPVLGFEGTLALCAALNLGLAALAALLFEWRRPWVAALAALGAVALFLLPPTTPWSVLRSTSIGGAGAWGEVHYFGVGRSATVMLTDQHHYLGLRTNGLPEAGLARPGSWRNRDTITRWLTALPVLARPEARSLLLVGFGGGVALEILPASLEQVHVVELEPEVLAANRSASAERWRDPLADPRLQVHLNDARNALLLADTKFDAIVSQPSHPWAGGAAHLYTEEFFGLARSRLAEGGVYVQWIGLPFVNDALFRSLLATFESVFAHVNVYQPDTESGVLFLASDRPFDMAGSAARAVAASPEEFGLLGIQAAADVSSRRVLDEAGVRELAAGAPANRDGHNRLQNESGRLQGEHLLGRFDELYGELDPLIAAPPGEQTELFYVLRRLRTERIRRVAAALGDPVDREVAEALAEISEGKRVSARRRLEQVLAEEPQHEQGRAALLSLSIGKLVAGTDPAEVLAPPLSEEEVALAAGWPARESDRSGASLRALEPALAAVAIGHPLGPSAARLRIQARLLSDDPELHQEAVALADASFGDRPGARSLLLRAESYAKIEQYSAVLETLSLLRWRLPPGLPQNRALLRRARELVRAVPDDPELREPLFHTTRQLRSHPDA